MLHKPQIGPQHCDSNEPYKRIIRAASTVLFAGKITVRDVCSPYKNPEFVAVRDIVVYLMHLDLKLGGKPMSFAQIGKRLGGRTNNTTLHAWNKINARLEADEDFRKIVEKIRTLYI